MNKDGINFLWRAFRENVEDMLYYDTSDYLRKYFGAQAIGVLRVIHRFDDIVYEDWEMYFNAVYEHMHHPHEGVSI